jgi:hypothetical protein
MQYAGDDNRFKDVAVVDDGIIYAVGESDERGIIV